MEPVQSEDKTRDVYGLRDKLREALKQGQPIGEIFTHSGYVAEPGCGTGYFTFKLIPLNHTAPLYPRVDLAQPYAVAMISVIMHALTTNQEIKIGWDDATHFVQVAFI